MQCSNCQFHNMPGSDVCGRCGSSLRLATAVIDVHPPRAGRLRKRLRRAVPVTRAVAEARDAIESLGPTSKILRVAARTPWALFLRLVIPGWSHFYAGQRVRAHLFLWGTLAFLAPGILLFGTLAGSLLLGMAFSVHSWAALDIVTQTFPDCGMRDRMARSLLVSFVLAAVIYLPVGYVTTRVADPTTIRLPMAPFADGDVVLVNHWVAPGAGDVVLYAIPDYTRREPQQRANRFVQYTGERIDRVLAGPGDRVVWDKGRLTVNGSASAARPLNPDVAPPRLKLTVPDGHFLILPTTTPYVSPADDEGSWQALSLVPADRVVGRVYARTSPLSRLARIR
jgi:hypothetical protein